jgi:hypothetical protein
MRGSAPTALTIRIEASFSRILLITPSYSLAVEKVKTAFRVLYSLFDKIAFFLNHYLRLSIPERQINFRTFWYGSQDKRRGLRPEFQNRENWPLRGLFWLSKDLYEDKPGFKEAIEPDAQALSLIRNHIEHKYLKLHEFGPPPAPEEDEDLLPPLTDTLAFSLGRDEFEAKTLRLMKITRAALIYLVLAIYREERTRVKDRDSVCVIPSISAIAINDELKI